MVLKLISFIFREYVKTIHASHIDDPRFSHVPSNKVSGKKMFNLNIQKSFLVEFDHIFKDTTIT